MTRKLFILLILMVGIAFWPDLATAAEPAAAPAAADAEPSDEETTIQEDFEVDNQPVEPATPKNAIQWIEAAREPAPWLKFNGDIRLREVFTPNLLLDQEDRHFQRYRFRLGSQITPIENLDLNVRLVYEPRHYCEPDRIDADIYDEAIFDQMNIEVKNIAGLPLKAKVGRQDIIFGNGWLILDGTPLDGSRTIFFDAARATLELKEQKTVVDVIFVDNHADSDYWLPPFCDKDFHNIEQDEKGVILYVTNKSLKDTQLDGYFIFKHDRRVLGPPTVAPWQAGTDADIYVFGGRVAGNIINDHWKYRAEFAQEFGQKNYDTLCALGANAQLAYHFNDKLKNSVRVEYEYLSGDDPDTATNEQFDPLWGRWPQWSELLAYTVALENRPGEFTNLQRFALGWTAFPTPKAEVRANYHLLFAAQKDSYENGANAGFFSNDSSFRGQLLTGWFIYKFNEHVSSHVVAELFFPGNFYSDARNDVAGFFRYQLEFTW